MFVLLLWFSMLVYSMAFYLMIYPLLPTTFPSFSIYVLGGIVIMVLLSWIWWKGSKK